MVAVVDNTFADGKDGRWVGMCGSFGLCQRKRCWLLSSAFRPHCMAFTSAVGSLRHLHTSFRWSLMAADWQGQMARVTEQDWNLLNPNTVLFLFCFFFFQMLWFTVCFPVNLIWDVLLEKLLWCLWRALKMAHQKFHVFLRQKSHLEKGCGAFISILSDSEVDSCEKRPQLLLWGDALAEVLGSGAVRLKSSLCGPTVKCDGQQLHLWVHCLCVRVCVGRDSVRISAGWLMDTPVGCHNIDPLVIAAVLRTVPSISSSHFCHHLL